MKEIANWVYEPFFPFEAKSVRFTWLTRDHPTRIAACSTEDACTAGAGKLLLFINYHHGNIDMN